MPSDESDPHASEADAPSGDLDAPPSGASLITTEDGAALDADDAGATVSPEVVREFLARPSTKSWLAAFMRRRAAPQHTSDLVQDVIVQALQASSLPASWAALPGWTAGVAKHVLADHHRRRARRAKYEAPLPERPIRRTPDDEPLDPVEAQDEPDDPDEASYEPFAEDTFDPGRAFIGPWLDKQVAGDARDRETLDIMLERARTGRTYQAIADARGMTLTELSSRIFRFKSEYVPRWKRHRDRMVLVILLLGAAMVAMVVAWMLRPVAKPLPEPRPYVVPDVPPSVTMEPPPPLPLPPPFEPAQPRQPRDPKAPRPLK